MTGRSAKFGGSRATTAATSNAQAAVASTIAAPRQKRALSQNRCAEAISDMAAD
jgi:hypothetical protein